MVANPTVNMGGAVLLTGLAIAKAARIAEDRLVHVSGGASAEEPRDYLLRDQSYEAARSNMRGDAAHGGRCPHAGARAAA
jgi:acetyl-CoA C-acetyltransferase